MMKLITLTATALLLSTAASFADGTHAHDDDWEVGRPGNAAEVGRSIEITMVEPEAGGMAFEPSELSIALGETVRFVVTNVGFLDHEIVFDTEEANAEHAAVMQANPDMKHDDPNAISLAPGESGELIWTFSQAGTFQFACLIGGHMEAGMHGPVSVN
jgi:uncharacterized cupredoxin-like copper-binding protein